MKNLNSTDTVKELRVTWEVYDEKLNKKETLSFNHSIHFVEVKSKKHKCPKHI